MIFAMTQIPLGPKQLPIIKYLQWRSPPLLETVHLIPDALTHSPHCIAKTAISILNHVTHALILRGETRRVIDE
jgi:hypothetical protein